MDSAQFNNSADHNNSNTKPVPGNHPYFNISVNSHLLFNKECSSSYENSDYQKGIDMK